MTLVKVDGDPFAQKPPEQKHGGQVSMSAGRQSKHQDLMKAIEGFVNESTVNGEVTVKIDGDPFATVIPVLTRLAEIWEATLHNQVRLIQALDRLAQPKRVQIVRDRAGVAQEAMIAHGEPRSKETMQ